MSRIKGWTKQELRVEDVYTHEDGSTVLVGPSFTMIEPDGSLSRWRVQVTKRLEANRASKKHMRFSTEKEARAWATTFMRGHSQ